MSTPPTLLMEYDTFFYLLVWQACFTMLYGSVIMQSLNVQYLCVHSTLSIGW